MLNPKLLFKVILLLVICKMSYAVSPHELPLHENVFTENKGQVKDQNGKTASNVRYIFSGKSFNLILKEKGFSYELFQYDNQPFLSEAGSQSTSDDELVIPERKVTIERFDASFLNPSKNMNIVAEGESSHYLNYYLGNASPSIVNVRGFKRICYQNIYPNVDLVFIASDDKGKELEYEYIVHPGGNILDIKVEYKTPNGLTMEDGSVVIGGRLGFVKEQGLFCYQNDPAFALTSRFLVKGNILSFDVRNYDRKSTTVIDPTLVWGTFYGGEGEEQFNQEVAVDNQSNVVLAGTTNSTTNIASSGAYQTSFQGSPSDVCIAKFNSVGTLLWSTFFGGNSQDICNSVAIDYQGNIIVAGNSTSSNITTPGAYQELSAGQGDVLLAKFDGNGQITWCTLYGGHLPDQARSVCVDNKGDIYMGCYGNSSQGISTSGVYQPTYGGAGDAYITKFTGSGALRWGSYFSGPGQDRAHTVCVDGKGGVYIGGTCESTTGIATSGAHQTTYGGGTADGFLAKFDTSNGHLFWATYYGGEAEEHVRGVITDGAGNVYLDGYTLSKVNIATTNAYQPHISIKNGGDTAKYTDAFLAKFTSAGHRIWATYYGGTKSEECFGISVDPHANIFIAGSTTSDDSIASSDAYQAALASAPDDDGFFAEMDSAGHRLYGTYLGGSLVDEIYDLDADVSGNLYTTTRSSSSNLPITAGAYQSINNGNSDYTVFKFSFNAACVDAYEPNNAKPTAFPLVIPVENSLLVHALIGTATDKDFFSFTNSAAAPNIKVQLKNLPKNYNLFLFSPSGIQIGASKSKKKNDELIIYNTSTVGTYKIKVQGVNSAYDDSLCYDLTIDLSNTPFRLTGETSYSDSKEILLYPNPASQQLNIDLQNNIEGAGQIMIYDLLGKMVLSQKFDTPDKVSVDVSGLDDGMYLMRVQTRNTYQQQIFLVSR